MSLGAFDSPFGLAQSGTFDAWREGEQRPRAIRSTAFTSASLSVLRPLRPLLKWNAPLVYLVKLPAGRYVIEKFRTGEVHSPDVNSDLRPIIHEPEVAHEWTASNRLNFPSVVHLEAASILRVSRYPCDDLLVRRKPDLIATAARRYLRVSTIFRNDVNAPMLPYVSASNLQRCRRLSTEADADHKEHDQP
jgi:hypothetical protein